MQSRTVDPVYVLGKLQTMEHAGAQVYRTILSTLCVSKIWWSQCGYNDTNINTLKGGTMTTATCFLWQIFLVLTSPPTHMQYHLLSLSVIMTVMLLWPLGHPPLTTAQKAWMRWCLHEEWGTGTWVSWGTSLGQRICNLTSKAASHGNMLAWSIRELA
jgi:hypothetical protein